MSLPSKLISLSLPEELIQKTDAAAVGDYSSRSEFIRQAIVEKLRRAETDVLASGNPDSSEDSFNVPMTDQKLEQVLEALKREHLRRHLVKENARPKPDGHKRPSAKY